MQFTWISYAITPRGDLQPALSLYNLLFLVQFYHSEIEFILSEGGNMNLSKKKIVWKNSNSNLFQSDFIKNKKSKAQFDLNPKKKSKWLK